MITGVALRISPIKNRYHYLLLLLLLLLQCFDAVGWASRGAGLPDWAKKGPIGLLLTVVGSIKFGFGALLLFGLLFESLFLISENLFLVFT